uniref:Uncharacterized protein n=1 Tax=Branchiostoma floridae TaxID=7739 RepID=C3ZAZ6_BRAFL|eukprot:XP_002594022.1 hypothetical protein BRAFLDRAFT_68538 [Branchiostoma floridae]
MPWLKVVDQVHVNTHTWTIFLSTVGLATDLLDRDVILRYNEIRGENVSVATSIQVSEHAHHVSQMGEGLQRKVNRQIQKCGRVVVSLRSAGNFLWLMPQYENSASVEKPNSDQAKLHIYLDLVNNTPQDVVRPVARDTVTVEQLQGSEQKPQLTLHQLTMQMNMKFPYCRIINYMHKVIEHVQEVGRSALLNDEEPEEAQVRPEVRGDPVVREDEEAELEAPGVDGQPDEEDPRRLCISREVAATSSRGVFATSSREVFAASSREMFATSSREVFATSSRGVFATSSREVFATSSREVFTASSGKVFTASSGGVFATSSREVFASSSREVFATSSREVFATSSREVFTASSGKVFTASSGGVFATSNREVFAASSREVFAASSREVFTASSRGVFATSSREVFAASSREVFAASSRGVFAASSRGVFASSSREVFAASSRWVFATSSREVFATSSREVSVLLRDRTRSEET